MATRITVIGTGYVGLIQAVGLADFGNHVTGLDERAEIVARLSAGEPTIFEHGLSEYLQLNVRSGRLRFTTNASKAISGADVVFIAVGTPVAEDGTADLSQLRSAVSQIAEHAQGFTVIVTKSTVPVGTNRWIARELSHNSGRSGAADRRFAVASNPEFLREGRAIQDFFHPDRVVVGFDDPSSDEACRAREILEEIYRPLYLISVPFVWTNLETAELAKYASNAFLAAKITFINQMANLAETVGADIHTIARAMGMDGRISPRFLHPGPGYGGSCFPKDTRALAAAGDANGVDMDLVKAVIAGNDAQKEHTARKIIRLLGEHAATKTVAVLGVAFKAETDDVRESPAITIVDRLLSAGATVHVHDPKALPNFKELLGDRLRYFDDVLTCIADTDCIVILTEWNEYRNMDLRKAASLMRVSDPPGKPILVDTRNVLDPGGARAAGFDYYGTGR